MGLGIDEVCRRYRSQIFLLKSEAIPKGDGMVGFGMAVVPHVPQRFIARSNGHKNFNPKFSICDESQILFS